MKMGTTRSPKFRRLSRTTSMSTRETVGTLELLWLFTMEQAPAGDIGKWPDEEIEEVCEWDGEPGALVSALVETGWLDGCAKHRLIVHDWADHVPEFIKLRIKRGSLRLAELVPMPIQPVADPTPTGRQRVAVDREGKGREAKGREEKRPEPEAPSAPAAMRPFSAPSSGKIPRPDAFDDASRERIQRWAAEKGFSPAVLNGGMELFREWKPLKNKTRTMDEWVSPFMKIVREGVEKGQLVDKRKPAGLAYRPADDVIAEAKRKQAEDEARRVTETPESIGQLIDLSLRQANGA